MGMGFLRPVRCFFGFFVGCPLMLTLTVAAFAFTAALTVFTGMYDVKLLCVSGKSVTKKIWGIFGSPKKDDTSMKGCVWFSWAIWANWTFASKPNTNVAAEYRFFPGTAFRR